MLSSHFRTRVNQIIEESRHFVPEDFLWAQSSNPIRFSVGYRFDQRFEFSAEKTIVRTTAQILAGDSSSGTAVFRCSSSPGSMEAKEITDVSATDAEKVLGLIRNWLKHLREEIIAGPVLRRLEEQRAQIETLISQTEGFSNEYFSKEEAAEVKQKLADLETELKAKIQEGNASQQEMQARTADLQVKMAELRSQLEILTKKNWVASALARFTRWASQPENEGLLRGGANVIKALLPGPPEK